MTLSDLAVPLREWVRAEIQGTTNYYGSPGHDDAFSDAEFRLVVNMLCSMSGATEMAILRERIAMLEQRMAFLEIENGA